MKVMEIKGLRKQYPSFALKDVGFTLESGTIMGFIGRNGAGKTTTLKSILNLVHPDGGEIRFFEKDLSSNEEEIKQRIGFASGAASYFKKKKIKDIVAVTKAFYRNWDDEAWEHYRNVFKLVEDKTPEQLSEGMKVKFNIAIALSHRAELLILDEPTSGLDPVSREELLDIFLQLKQKGVSLLFSTHITSDLEKCADIITYIKNGEILDSTTLSDFLEKNRDKGGTLEDIMTAYEKEEIVL